LHNVQEEDQRDSDSSNSAPKRTKRLHKKLLTNLKSTNVLLALRLLLDTQPEETTAAATTITETTDNRSRGRSNNNNNNSQRTRAPRTRRSNSKPRTPSTTLVYVSNLPFSVDDKGLAGLFTGYKVAKAYVAVRRNGKSKGFGFVDFANHEEQTKATKLNGHEVEGRPLTVQIANIPEARETTPTTPTTNTK